MSIRIVVVPVQGPPRIHHIPPAGGDPDRWGVGGDRHKALWHLAHLQALVGGYLEPIALVDGLTALVDEEGLIKTPRPPVNEHPLPGPAGQPRTILGPYVLCRYDRDGELVSVTDEDVRFAEAEG